MPTYLVTVEMRDRANPNEILTHTYKGEWKDEEQARYLGLVPALQEHASLHPEDPTLFVTALRETQEEVSVVPENIEILGSLSPLYIPPSRFHVTPIVGWYDGPVQFLKSEDEVSELYITPLSLFLDERIKTERNFKTHTGISTKAPAYIIGDEFMWGATAMIFAEFTEVYGDLI